MISYVLTTKQQHAATCVRAILTMEVVQVSSIFLLSQSKGCSRKFFVQVHLNRPILFLTSENGEKQIEEEHSYRKRHKRC